jgi:hypothetical protein
LRVIQLFILDNGGERTYIGQDGQTFTFDLPQAATNVTFQHNTGNIQETDEGYIATEPVFPGQEGLVIALIYDLPYEGNTLDVTLPLPQDVASVGLLLQDQGADLTSDQLQFVGMREREGTQFGFYSGEGLQQAEGLDLRLTGLDDLQFSPAPVDLPAGTMVAPATNFDQNLARWVVIGIIALIIVGAGALCPYRRPQTVEDTAAHRQKLLLLLARLDDAFEAGELNEQVYRQARAHYKADLAGLWERVP